MGFADKLPCELSGGTQQRAAIARALSHDPKRVLVEEPLGALDALMREKMNLEMLRIRGETGKKFVLVTHHIQEAIFFGTHCAVLTAGPARMADFFPIELPASRRLCTSKRTSDSVPASGASTTCSAWNRKSNWPHRGRTPRIRS